MNIVFIAPECYPYAKASGLADHIYGLAKALEGEGNNVKIFLPRYGSIDPVENHIERLPNEIKINYDGGSAIAYKGIIKDSLVSIFFIDNQQHFSNSKEVYLSEKEDLDRFDFFCKSALTLISKMRFDVDVVHLFNPQVAFAAKYMSEDKTFNSNAKMLFSIYNLKHLQGKFLRNTTEAINIADKVITTSSVYKDELLSSNSPLQLVLSSKKTEFYGMLSDLDLEAYNPETNKNITSNFSSGYFSVGKRKCKEELLEISDVDDDLQVPLFSYSGDITKEEGADLLLSSIPQIIGLNLNLIIHGRGDVSIEKELQELSSRYDNFKYFHGNDLNLTKKIYSGSDFVISPGRCESSGLSLIAAMRYGCIPVVYYSSTLKEIVSSFDEKSGNAITFDKKDRGALLDALGVALRTFSNKKAWTALVKEVMNFKIHSEKPFEGYLQLYEKLNTELLGNVSQ